MGNHARLYPPVWGRGTDGAEEDLLPAHQPLLRHCLVLGSGAPVIGIRIDGNASPRGKKPCDFNVLGSHQPDEVFQDDVDAVFMESAMVAEAEEVELQAFAFHHLDVGDIADADLCEIRLAGDGAQAGEFGAFSSAIITLFCYSNISFLLFKYLINPSRRNLHAGQWPHPSP